MPFQEFAAGPVGAAFRQVDDLSGLGVELVAVAEVCLQARADEQAVLRVHAEVPAVEQGVDIGSEQEPVVEPVLPAPGNRANVSRLQDRRDVRAADRAAPAVGIQDNRLEGLDRKSVV